MVNFAFSQEVWKHQYGGHRNSLENPQIELYQKGEEKALNLSIPICTLYSRALFRVSGKEIEQDLF